LTRRTGFRGVLKKPIRKKDCWRGLLRIGEVKEVLWQMKAQKGKGERKGGFGGLIFL